jgi:predicted nuclease of predicted toxin-antitoxin system
VDVTTTAEAGLLHASDDVQLAFAVAQGRVIVTQDTDFLRIAATGQPSPGIVFYPAQHSAIGKVIRNQLLVWEVYEPDEIRNRVEFL